MNELKIVKATKDDLRSLQNIGRETFSETFAAVNTEENMQKYLAESFDKKKLLAELSDKSSAFYMAILEHQVIGYLKVNWGNSQTEIKDPKAFEIERIYVLRVYYGKQIGQLLYEHAHKMALEKKAEYIWLGVWEKNARAIGFYTKNGFTAFSQHIFKLGEDKQTDIMMKKILAS